MSMTNCTCMTYANYFRGERIYLRSDNRSILFIDVVHTRGCVFFVVKAAIQQKQNVKR